MLNVTITNEQFEQDLNFCLTIIEEPTANNNYYICEYISAGLHTKLVKIFITN